MKLITTYFTTFSHSVLIVFFSLQIEPFKRPKASELLTHPFITRHLHADAELIFWLKDYLEIRDRVRKRNLEQQAELEMSLSDLVGLK